MKNNAHHKTKAPPSRLRLRRVTLGLTLDDVVRLLDFERARVGGRSALSRWERGDEVPSDVLPILARVLRCKTGDIA